MDTLESLKDDLKLARAELCDARERVIDCEFGIQAIQSAIARLEPKTSLYENPQANPAI